MSYVSFSFQMILLNNYAVADAFEEKIIKSKKFLLKGQMNYEQNKVYFPFFR